MVKTLVALGAAAAIGAGAFTTPTPAAAQPWVAPVVIGSVIAGGIVGAAVASSSYYYQPRGLFDFRYSDDVSYVNYGHPAQGCNCQPPADAYVYAPRVYYQPDVQPYYQSYIQPYYQSYVQPYYPRYAPPYYQGYRRYYARPHYQRYAFYRRYDRPYARPYYRTHYRNW